MPVNDVDHPVLECLQDRWSPYRFEPCELEDAKLMSCLEAARWAASSFNDQPWFWIIARRQETEEFARMLSCLMEANQGWAANAGVLVKPVDDVSRVVETVTAALTFAFSTYRSVAVLISQRIIGYKVWK